MARSILRRRFSARYGFMASSRWRLAESRLLPRTAESIRRSCPASSPDSGCGADGVAVVSALFAQADVKAAAEELLRLSEEIAR